MSLISKKFKWMDDGLCLNVGSTLFISNKEKDRLEAMTVCDGCPVKNKCYDYAVEKRDQHGSTTVGVWGGVDFGK